MTRAIWSRIVGIFELPKFLSSEKPSNDEHDAQTSEYRRGGAMTEEERAELLLWTSHF
jgi:hypothetical protein